MFCFSCVLFAKDVKRGKAFVTSGVKSWNKIYGEDCKLVKHTCPSSQISLIFYLCIIGKIYHNANNP